MKKGTRRGRLFPLTSIATVAILFFLTFFSVYGAESIGYQTGGGTLAYQPPQTTLADQKSVLEDCGFIVSSDETTGELTLQLNDSSASGIGGALNQAGTSALKNKHSKLIENGILSYIVYENSICNIMTDLVVCLDFTDYRITTFDEGFLNGLTYAITGSSQLLWYGASFTETTASGTVQIIDSAFGGVVTNRSASLYLRGISANYPSTITIYDENGMEVSKNNITSYSLHIVLPRNNLLEGEVSTITFNKGSLVSTGIADLAASPPTSIGLDISNMVVSGGDYLYIDPTATDGNTNHFHYIGSTAEQLQFCLKRSLDYVTDETHTTNDYVEEIFSKPFSNTHFCRVYAGVGKAGGSPYVSVYDKPSASTTSEERTATVLALFYGIRYLYQFPDGNDPTDFTYYHYTRGEDNLVSETAGTFTCDWTVETANPDKLHAVHCSHAHGANSNEPTLVGYFDANGTLYDAFGQVLA